MAIKYYFSKIAEMFHKSRKVYGRNNEFKFLKVIFFNIILIILDLLSIALILPAIDLVVNSGKSTSFNIPVFSNKLNLNYLLFSIVIMFGIKSILTLMINKYQFKIIFNLSKNLSETIYKKYIKKSYVFFTEKTLNRSHKSGRTLFSWYLPLRLTCTHQSQLTYNKLTFLFQDVE